MKAAPHLSAEEHCAGSALELGKKVFIFLKIFFMLHNIALTLPTKKQRNLPSKECLLTTKTSVGLSM